MVNSFRLLVCLFFFAVFGCGKVRNPVRKARKGPGLVTGFTVLGPDGLLPVWAPAAPSLLVVLLKDLLSLTITQQQREALCLINAAMELIFCIINSREAILEACCLSSVWLLEANVYGSVAVKGRKHAGRGSKSQ